MADIDYHGAGYGGGIGGAWSRASEALGAVPWASWAGALSTLALAGGLAVWAVDLTFRDVRAVPVIQALEGPMRVAPADPGGTNAPHQGLALSEITAGGVASPAPDRIVLAPPPAAMDAPSMAARAARIDAEPDAAAPVPAASDDAVALLADGPVAPVGDVEEIALPVAFDDLEGRDLDAAIALTEADEADEADLGPAAPPLDLAALIEATVAEALEMGPVRSSRPPRRPADLRPEAALVEAEPVQVASAGGVRDVDPVTLGPGARLIQLGAFDSEAIARDEWLRLQARFGDYLAGRSPVVQQASSGDRDFWRLRAAGFTDAASTRRLCTALLAQGQACIPVTLR